MTNAPADPILFYRPEQRVLDALKEQDARIDELEEAACTVVIMAEREPHRRAWATIDAIVRRDLDEARARRDHTAQTTVCDLCERTTYRAAAHRSAQLVCCTPCDHLRDIAKSANACRAFLATLPGPDVMDFWQLGSAWHVGDPTDKWRAGKAAFLAFCRERGLKLHPTIR